MSVCGRVLVLYHEDNPTLEQTRYEHETYTSRIDAQGPGAVLIVAEKAFPPPKQAIMSAWRDFATQPRVGMRSLAIVSDVPKVGLTSSSQR